MTKIKSIMSSATDNRTFKRAYNKIITSCPKCSPNKGCNRRRKNVQRSWKKFRTNKYK